MGTCSVYDSIFIFVKKEDEKNSRLRDIHISLTMSTQILN